MMDQNDPNQSQMPPANQADAGASPFQSPTQPQPMMPPQPGSNMPQPGMPQQNQTDPAAGSYVDSYQPPQAPQSNPAPAQPASPVQNPMAQAMSQPQPQPTQPPQPVTTPTQPANPFMAQPLPDVTEPAPQPQTPFQPAPAQSMPAPQTPVEGAGNADAMENDDLLEELSQSMEGETETSSATAPSGEQSLESQNIFFLLGVTDGSDEEREGFLDELQEVIWDDFLDRDAELLLTSDEFSALQQKRQEMSEANTPSEEQQEAIITHLEGILPDLEDILLEKALELKADMFKERLAGLREFYAGKEDELQIIAEAEALMNDGQWKTAAEKMNEQQARNVD